LEQYQAVNLFSHPGLMRDGGSQALSSVLQNDSRRQFEYQILKASGQVIDVRATLSCVTLSGQPHFLLQKIDVSLEHARQKALSAYWTAIDAQLIVSRLDECGRLTYVNDAYLNYSGYGREELIGQFHTVIRPQDTSQQSEEFQDRLRSTGIARRDLWRNVTRSGEDRWCSLVAMRLPPNETGQIETLVLRTDLTELVKANQVAEQAQVQAHVERLAGVRKDEFLATVSHELRTPLNGILGMLQTMERKLHDDSTPGLLHYVHNARGAAQTLLALVNDILDFSRLRDARLELHPGPVRIDQACDAARDVVQALADERGLTLRVECEPGTAHFVMMDQHRFTQILINLLSNAIKFTESGSVILSAGCEPAPQGMLGLCIRVVDTGVGMTPEFLPRLFDRFSQVQPQDGSRGGAGLGMAIVKQLVGLMGGSIDVESRPGQGTSVTVRLAAPLASAEQQASRPDPEYSLPSGLRVLYAEDDELNRLVVATLLEDTGVTLETVENGQQAVERVLAPGAQIDLVLMDLQMPTLDGIGATLKIREHRTAQELPIIGLSAHAFDQQVQHARQAGMTGFLSKPVLREELLRELAQAVGSRTNAIRMDVSGPGQSSPVAHAAMIDLERMQKQMGGSLQRVRVLLDMFLQQTPELIEQIGTAIAQGDVATVRRLAHQLKGRLSMAASEVLLASCQALEAAAQAQDGHALPERFEQMRAHYSLVERDLRSWLAEQPDAT
jgi:PAS domain S-box-containing protein